MTKHKKQQGALAVKPASGMALAANWPVYEVLLSRGWDEEAALVTTLIARQSPNSGKIAVASLLIDLACLGVKSAQVALYKTPQEYQRGLREHVLGIQPMASASFNLVAKIIETGVNYAASLGFKPDPVFNQAQYLLQGADPNADPTPVPTGGRDGKPLFVAGPNDNPAQIVAQLERTVGTGNFHYLMGVDEL